MNVLVTGGAGFIGSALVERLFREGHTVSVLDDFSRSSPTALGQLRRSVRCFKGSVENANLVHACAIAADAVFHLAAVNGTETFYSEPRRVLETSIRGTLNVINACREHKVKTLLYASSSEVYGHSPDVPTPEIAPLIVPDVLNPRYSYSGGKIASELLVLHSGIPRVLIVRPHNVYGPKMGDKHVIPQLTKKILRQLEQNPRAPTVDLEIQGTGKETRAFCYVNDAIDGIFLVREQGDNRGIYNIGSMEETTIEALAQQIGALLGVQLRLKPSQLQLGSPLRRCPDTRALELLGAFPKFSLEEGLAETVRWYKDEWTLQKGLTP